MQPYQIRVIEERDQLAERLSKLFAFIRTSIFSQLSETETHRIDKQRIIMEMYLDVLNDRIRNF